MISCPNSGLGCQASLPLSECEAHLLSCKFQPQYPGSKYESATCTSCGEIVLEETMSKHLTLICPNKTVACTFTSIGCKQKVPRRLLQVLYTILSIGLTNMLCSLSKGPFHQNKTFNIPSSLLELYFRSKIANWHKQSFRQ